MTSICLAGLNSPVKYSGGRYHGWILAEALAALGLDVTYWTNAEPLVGRDFECYPGHSAIKLHIDPFFSDPPKASTFDFSWIIPHHGEVWAFNRWMHHFVKVANRRILLNFETPNWYQEAGHKEISPINWLGWELSARCCEAIVSSLELSSHYARKYFTDVSPNSEFLSLPPAINSLVADQTASVPRSQKRIFLATRFNAGSSQHKGGHYLLNFLINEFRGYEIVVLMGGGTRKNKVVTQIGQDATRNGIRLILLRGITDRQKFEWIRSSEVSVFPSSFEGYGYPPIESLYCDTPCIAFDLPNYAETCGSGLTRTPQKAIEEVVCRVLQHDFIAGPEQFEQAKSTGSFDCFTQRVSGVLEKVAATETTPELWPAALQLLTQHHRPRTWKFYLKNVLKSRFPHTLRSIKSCYDAVRS